MSNLSIFVSAIFMFCNITLHAELQVQLADTASINNITREAYIDARRNPDQSILKSYKALSSSMQLGYVKGRADASLALGMAYFARYNYGDSATYYNKAAFNLYDSIGDITGKARACYGLCYVYSLKGDLAQSEEYGEMSLEYFEEAGDNRGMVNALSTIIYLARQAKDNDRALDLVERSIDISEQSFDTVSLAEVLNTRGNIYKDMLLFTEAIESYFEALRLWEIKGDSSGMAIAYGSVGLMYYFQEDYDRALEYNFKKLPISETDGNLWEQSKTLNNIAQIYSARGMHDSSLFYLGQSLHITNQMNYASGEAVVCNNIASAMLIKGDADSALYYSKRAVSIAEAISDASLASCLVTKGQVLVRLGNYSEGMKSAERAYNMASEQDDPLVLSKAAALMSDISLYYGRSDLAYSYLVEFHKLKDSITNNDYLRKVTRLEIESEYERMKKEDELVQMEELFIRESKIKKQRTILNGFIILIVIFGILLLIYIRHNRLRLQYTRIDLEQRLLRAQMNPHFIFNSLCAIQDFILSGKPVKANAFLVKIASLMRNILENSREEYISLDKEIETLRLYLDVQQLRFEEEFDYNFNIDDSIDPENISVPPMLAQPCLENSIEHGLLPKKTKGRLEVSYSLKNDILMLEVVDNGVGRGTASKEQQPRIRKKSISTELTQSRLEYFRKTLKEKNIAIEIIDLYNEEQPSGTKVILKMPCKKIFA